MNSDSMARALVPLLLNKSDKLRRGCDARPGGQADGAAIQGLYQLGFLLGGCLQSKEVQSTFGLSRQAASEHKVPLTNKFLPQFFCAQGTALVESVNASLCLLQQDGVEQPYMIVKDEVVFARTFSMIYGMSHFADF